MLDKLGRHSLAFKMYSLTKVGKDEVTADDIKDAITEREERAKAAEQARLDAEQARLEAEAAGNNAPVEGEEAE